MKKTISIIGSLLIITSLLWVYISFDGKARLRIDDDKSVFYVNDSGWKISGLQEDRLFLGNKIIDRVTKSINRYNYTEGNLRVEKRETTYENNEKIIHTWKLDPYASNIEDFPIDEKICIYNATGKYYRYSLKKLKEAGPKRKVTSTSEEFGYNMKVDFPLGYSWAWIGWPYGKDSFAVQYKIKNDDECFDIRLFDPPSSDTELIVDLLAYWTFDTITTSEFGGVTANLTTGGSIIDGNTCKNDGCVQLDGVSGLINLTKATDIGITTDEWCVSMWINQNSTVPSPVYFAFGKKSVNTELLLFHSAAGGGLRHAGIADGISSTDYIPSKNFTNNLTSHLIWTFNGTDYNVYINGTNASNITQAGFQPTDNNITFIGAIVEGASHGQFLKGTVDEVSIWNRACSVNDVAALWNNGTGNFDFWDVSFSYSLTLNPLLNQTKTIGNLFSPNWSLADSQINMSDPVFAGGNFTLNLTQYNITTQGTAWTYNITNIGEAEFVFDISQNHTKSNYDLWMWNGSTKQWNITTTPTNPFNLTANESKLFNLTIDLFNSSLTTIDWVRSPLPMDWDFNITINITEK